MDKRLESDEEFDVGMGTFEEALALAKARAGPDKQIYLVETDPDGNEVLVPIKSEELDLN